MSDVPDLSPLEVARQLDKWGFNVLPTAVGEKLPLLKTWKRWQTERTTPMLEVWFGRGRAYGYFTPTGNALGLLVLDCDNAFTIEWWREKLGGDLFDKTLRVRTSKGMHLYFSIPVGVKCPSWSVHPPADLKDDPNQLSFDVRADGTGVVLPPSVHASGHVYVWESSPESTPRLSAPEILTVRRALGEGVGGALLEAPRSMLTQLLNNPPARGGRNDWLTKVSGHYAKQFHFAKDAYELHVRQANANLDDPLDDPELNKTLESIWASEQEQVRQSGEVADTTGYLISGDNQIMTLVSSGKGAQRELSLEPWSDFNIRALGVTEYGDQRTYDVELLLSGREPVKAIMPSKVFGSPNDLRRWLAGYDASILPPNGEVYRGSVPERLLRYVKAQNPPYYKSLPSLGWHEGIGFVTHEGVITDEGMRPLDGMVPAPILRQWAPFHYGMGDEDEARAVLQEVLTFHDPVTCAVFGAWWAACFLKAQIMRITSLFPFVGIEAPSGSGKSNGYIPLMIQMSGNLLGQGEYTIADLRDRASAHRNGILHIDDLSHPEPVMDLLRQVTSEGVRSKKGQDRYSSETVRLVAPIVISGEGLGPISTEKALMDRAVQLHVSVPTDRRSRHDPGRLQWDDIRSLQARYNNNLTCFSGNYVQMALRCAPMLAELTDLRPYSGRAGDKLAIVRIGGRVLSAMAKQEVWTQLVDEWVSQQVPSPILNDNALTTEVLPILLAELQWPDKPEVRSGKRPTPAFIAPDGRIRFNTQMLAEEWRELRRGASTRLHTAQALAAQRAAIGVEGEAHRERVTIPGTDSRTKAWYWILSVEYSKIVLERSGASQQAKPDQNKGRLHSMQGTLHE